MKLPTAISITGLVFLFSLGLAACEKKGPLEKAGESADNAIENAADAAKKAADDAKEKLKDATN